MLKDGAYDVLKGAMVPKPKYDFAVAYRIYPKVSKVPPVFSDDKLKLSELCLKSFIQSYQPLRPKFFAILDNCPEEYVSLFAENIPAEDLEFIRLAKLGNAGTFGLQMKILSEQPHSDYIYFAEDDYFYLPGAFPHMLKFAASGDDVHFVTPYDHHDYYSMELHNSPHEVRFCSDRHWQTVGSTCMTFLTKKAVLAKAFEGLNTYT